MVLRWDDFVTHRVNWTPKSENIRSIAEELGLGLDAFVFVDDNEVELEEVSRALPAVRCLRFPAREDDLAGLLTRLADWFGRETITAEDRERTAMYRRRLEGLVPEGHAGADIRGFLQSLAMRLEVADRSRGDRVRAVQLINKTNQFNLNGRRWTDEDVEAILAGGGRLICATLSDRSGSHGEILALLMGADRVVEAWVMSCRVFQRRVEHAFLLALIDGGLAPAALRVARTERNEPMVRFLAELGVTEHPDGLAMFDAEGFRSAHEGERQLFQVAGASSLARFEHASGAESVLGRP
jgi:FkbH-like protein